MIRHIQGVLLVAIISVAMTGCVSLGKKAEKVLPKYDEVLVFDLPYDLTYLRTIEALESMDGWELVQTEKEKGIVEIRNDDFEGFDDRDKRLANVKITRLDRRITSVKLAEESQHVIGGDDLLKRVNTYVSREL